jgi:hypothetical protein
MTVTKKIEKSDVATETMKYISDGGEVRADLTNRKNKKTIALMMPVDFLSQMDSMIRSRVGLSRNAWILEAIQEKIERESME